MQHAHRHWLSICWIAGIMLFSLATAAACAGHRDVHEAAHASLCVHSSSPAAQRHDKPILFTEDGGFPLPPTFLVLVGFPAAMSTRLPLAVAVPRNSPKPLRASR